jgi:hypothetical protein
MSLAKAAACQDAKKGRAVIMFVTTRYRLAASSQSSNLSPRVIRASGSNRVESARWGEM